MSNKICIIGERVELTSQWIFTTYELFSSSLAQFAAITCRPHCSCTLFFRRPLTSVIFAVFCWGGGDLQGFNYQSCCAHKGSEFIRALSAPCRANMHEGTTFFSHPATSPRQQQLWSLSREWKETFAKPELVKWRWQNVEFKLAIIEVWHEKKTVLWWFLW